MDFDRPFLPFSFLFFSFHSLCFWSSRTYNVNFYVFPSWQCDLELALHTFGVCTLKSSSFHQNEVILPLCFSQTFNFISDNGLVFYPFSTHLVLLIRWHMNFQALNIRFICKHGWKTIDLKLEIPYAHGPKGREKIINDQIVTWN